MRSGAGPYSTEYSCGWTPDATVAYACMLATDRIPAAGLCGMTGLAYASASWKMWTTSLMPPASRMSG